jgi:quinol-cytochrome oxidoreductase complex cytochrome b subunit
MSFKSWWQESFPVDKKELDHAMSEPVPIHMKKWWWALGGTPLLMLIIQIITGLMLVFYYVPNPEFAYESISHITHVTPFGWLIRSIHRWASNIMIAALILHMMRVFFTGAYRAPRELNWMFGVIIFLITLGFGFTGYSLVYEQMSYWAMKVGTEIAGATPLIGGWIADFMRGGSEIGNQTLTRFFALHVILMPILMMTLLAVHIYLIRTLGIPS